jgi:hypothetical protein
LEGLKVGHSVDHLEARKAGHSEDRLEVRMVGHSEDRLEVQKAGHSEDRLEAQKAGHSEGRLKDHLVDRRAPLAMEEGLILFVRSILVPKQVQPQPPRLIAEEA